MSPRTSIDPLAVLTAPPPDENYEQRLRREARELEEKRVSDSIDDVIRVEERARKKEIKTRSVVHVLLLGQSESGKSTTLKNLRIKYAHSEWIQERKSWLAVIQLNLVRSILTIVQAVQEELERQVHPPVATATPDSEISVLDDTVIDEPSLDNHNLTSSPELKTLVRRLGPLRRVEADLRKKLGSATEELTANSDRTAQITKNESEFVVRCWSDALGTSSAANGISQLPSQISEDAVRADIIASCRDDMKDLWNNPEVKTLVKHKRLEDSAGFFLFDVDRIASKGYEPTDDDIIRARLRTVGVQEWKLQFDRAQGFAGSELGREWRVYDVGGSMTARFAWLPFFEMVHAIIFLAPISCFNERLAEDPSVNRLEDSFKLFRAIVQTPLLKNATIVLFLNKCDLLKRKLKYEKVKVSDYLTSYNGPQEVASVVRYLRDKFKEIAKELSPIPRTTYIYPTSVTDVKATSVTLQAVRDGILREHLKQADFV